MIVKNEERNLDRCLGSVKTVADQIVIVDTGSTDRTVEIARSHGAEVHHFEWCDDFAAARNAALDHATCQWVLTLDADEALTSASARVIRQAIASAPPDVWAYATPIRNFERDGGGSEYGTSVRVSLFRRRQELRYRYRIHECLVLSDQGMASRARFISDTRVILDHFGYTPTQMRDNAKIERNLRLLRQLTEDEPNEPYHWFHLGSNRAAAGDWPSATEALRRTIELSVGIPPFLEESFSLLVKTLSAGGSLASARATISEAESRLSETSAEFQCTAGDTLLGMGLADEAIRYYESSIRKRKNGPLAIRSDPGVRSWRPHAGIGQAHEMLGRYRDALASYVRAQQEAPKEASVGGRVACMLAILGDTERALDRIRYALLSQSADPRLLITLISDSARLAKAAGKDVSQTSLGLLADAVLDAVEMTPDTGLAFSDICLALGLWNRGLAAADQALVAGPSFKALANRGRCLFSLKRYAEAAKAFEDAEAALAQASVSII